MAISPEQLDDIYDHGIGEGEGPKPKPNKAVSLGTLDTPQSPVTFGGTSNTNVNDNIGYMPEGVYSNQDLEIVKGYRQSVPAKLGLRLANAVPNMLGSVAQMIGYTGALATEWGDDRDYSNAFTQAGEAIMNPFGQTFRRSHDTFALGDPTWWIDNVANLAEIAVPFAGEAKLASMGMEAVANTATKLLGLGEKGARIAQGTAQLGTAGFSAYTEAAMDGATVYDQVYKNQYDKQLYKGLSPDEAHTEAQHIAAQSAATTVQLSTAMTTLLNLSSVAPFFKKSEDVTKDVLRNQLTRKVDESLVDWSKRISSLNADDFKEIFGNHGKAKFLKEMGQEGFEEVEQQFAQQTGQDEGTKGKTHGLFEQLVQFENFFDRTMNKDGALAFVLGAAGGGLQTAIIENARTKRSTIDEAGNSMPQAVNADGTLKWDTATGNPVMKTKLVSPKTYDEWNTRKAFNNARDLVAEDVTNFAKMQAVYLAAAKKNDTVAMDKARNDMFNVTQLNAVTSGMTEPWVNTFREISNYDNTQSLDPQDENGPTEAMQRGYASSRSDSEYKAKATEAADDLQKYNAEYEKLQKRYGTTYEANEGIKDLVDMMFRRKVDLMTDEKLIKRHEEELSKLEQEEKELIQAADPESFNESLRGYHNQIQSAQAVHAQLKADHDTLVKAIDKKDYSKLGPLIRKYRAVGANDTDLQGAVNDLAGKLSRHMELQSEKAKSAEEAMFNSSGYSEWLIKHPDGKFEQYRKEIQKKYELNTTLPIYRANIDKFKAEHTIAAANYADIHNEKSIANFVKKSTDWRENIRAQALALQTKKQAEISKIVKDKATADRLQRIQLNQTAEVYKQKLSNAVQELNNKKAELKRVLDEMESLSYIKDPLRKLALKSQSTKLKSEIQTLEAQTKLYESYISDYSVDTSTPEGDVPTTGVVDEDDDLEKDEEEVIEPDLSTSIDMGPDEGTTTEELPSEIEELPADVEALISPDKTWDGLAKQWQETIENLPKSVQGKLSEIEERWKSGEAKSLNLLNPLVKEGYIKTLGRAAQLLNQLWELVQEDKQPVDTTPIDVVPETLTPATVDIATDNEPIDPVTDNSDPYFETSLAEDDWTHEGAKIVNTMSGATSTLKYQEVPIKDSKKIMKFATTELDQRANLNLLLPGFYQAGTGVTLTADTNYNGTINYDDKLVVEDTGERAQRADKFENYLDASGKIIMTDEMVGNVPLKIVDKDGKTVNYVRRLDWVTAKYPGTNNYRNIQDLIDDGEGGTIDNVKIQSEAILALHRQIAEEWNANKGGIEAKLLDKGIGIPILNRVVPKTFDTAHKVEFKYASELLPDKSLKIGVVKKGTVFTGKGFAFDRAIDQNTVTKYNDGMVGTLLPGANGTHIFYPLVGQKLTERKTNIQTATRIIELYLLNDGTNTEVEKEIEKIRSVTGFDVSTESGLRNFFSQYLTHHNSFSEAELSPNAPAKSGKKVEEFQFNITDKAPNSTKALIALGWTYSGKPMVKAALVNGTLDPKFIQELERGFSTRSKNVQYTDGKRGIKGINSTGKFVEYVRVLGNAEKGIKPHWKENKYDSYNEYVKSWSKTAIYGKNQVNGKYVYTANPQTPFEVTTKPAAKKVVVATNTSPAEVKLPANKVPQKEVTLEKLQQQIKETKSDLARKIADKDETRTKYYRNQLTELEKKEAELTGKPDFSTSLDVTPDVVPTTEVQQETPIDETKANDFLDLYNLSPDFSTTTVQELGSPSDGTKSLTIANLDNIFSTTPEINRNGRTVQEIYDDLQRRGHSFIPQGYNPFSLCK